MTRRYTTTPLRARLRAAHPRTPRGSSSLLRLSSAVSRWPSGAAIDQWIDRATRAMA
ncbi:MAG: hypothetical protein HC793_04010 [Aquincola sp.]|nr:hypothetical protein [Aquincola sp.]